MCAKYLASLNTSDMKNLINKLHASQHGNCFICEEPIDLEIHKDSIQIDHITPLQAKGKDGPENFALTHEHCNESKQTSNLQISRLLAKFEKMKKQVKNENRDSVTLADVLRTYNGSKYNFKFKVSNNIVKYSFSDYGDNKVYESEIFCDSISKQKSFFAQIPITYLFHDDIINPRGIGNNLRKLIEEFHKGRPQLHVALARIDTIDNASKILVFDGQHKTAAQILLGVKQLPIRLFIESNTDLLLTANTNAGDTLRQVAFDKSIKRQLGNCIFTDRITRYQNDHGLSSDDNNFTEKELVTYFKGEHREMKKYIHDAVRNSVTQHVDNKLRNYIDLSGRTKDKPLSYSTIDKAFYPLFIYPGLLSSTLDYKVDVGENPRLLEIAQLVKLMNIIAKEIYIDKFDFDLGINRIEHKIQKGIDIPESHLAAYRISKEEVVYNWAKYVRTIIREHFIHMGKHIEDDKPFQEPFPEQLWTHIAHFMKNLIGLPVWVNKDLSKTVFGGKQNNAYWEHVFRTGKTHSGSQIMPSGLNFIRMIDE
ncbi:MAG: HNH endonuclease [Cenarchaeum symbiont of Oopsacas minuta]|nr:HNH endonuclease [Cenarchaeum symbiont of Oopsacas minuta]